MMVSDIHYNKKSFHGQDQSKAFDWLYRIVEKEKPDLLLSAGDFGGDSNPELFLPIVRSTYLLTIYGNHDNVELIQTLRNRDGSLCLLQDGLVRSHENLKIAGINGNIARIKRKIHQKTVEEVREIISKYAQLMKTIDVFVTHEAPMHELISREKTTLGHEIFNEAIQEIKPKVHLCGHVHIPSQILRMNNTSLVNLDSSTRHQEYVLAEYKEKEICDIRVIYPNARKHHFL
jgi:Icc-related predicted phosphoesterase